MAIVNKKEPFRHDFGLENLQKINIFCIFAKNCNFICLSYWRPQRQGTKIFPNLKVLSKAHKREDSDQLGKQTSGIRK